LIDVQAIFRDLLQALRNPVAVQRAEGVERLQDHEVESALEDVLLRFGHDAAFLLKTNTKVAQLLLVVKRGQTRSACGSENAGEG
jgi:hypothetical protein